MDFITYNLFWMAFNALLALVPVLLVAFLRLKLPVLIHVIFFSIWLIFLPNTIYLITDFQHMPYQLMRSSMGEQAILIIQFVTLGVIGVVTYAYSLEPVGKIFKKLKLPEINREILYFVLNYIVAFGVVLGKVQRTHSWYVVTEPLRVVQDVLNTLRSSELLVLVLFIGTIINILFFLFRSYFPPLRASKKH